MMTGPVLAHHVRQALANPPGRLQRPTTIEALVEHVIATSSDGALLSPDDVIQRVARMPNYQRVHVTARVWRQHTARVLEARGSRID